MTYKFPYKESSYITVPAMLVTFILCAYNTMLLVMGDISKDGIEFKNYIFRFSSEEIINF